MSILRWLASTAVWLATGLWLGGMLFLFIGVQALFEAFPKQASSVAMQSAPRLFDAFERYQLILAAAALLGTFVWYCVTRSRLVIIIFLLLALTAAAAVVSSTTFSAKMQQLRIEGLSSSPQFRSLHARSMTLYTSQAVLLFAAAIMLPFATTRRRKVSAVAPE